MSEKPAWRELYDRVTDEVAPRMIEATGSDRFADAVEVVGAVRSRAASELQRSSRRWLHAWNLPTGTDIAMLRRELGALDREVRALTRQVESLQRQLEEANRPAAASRSARQRRSAS